MSEYTHPMTEYRIVPIAQPMRAAATLNQGPTSSLPERGDSWG